MPAPIAPARAAAFQILSRVATSAAHSDDLLHSIAVNALSPEDRNLTTTLVLGVLRWQLFLDTLIRPMLQRPDAELHPAAWLALRLGLFQLLYLDRIPPHAALNESVELAKVNGAAHAAGMVNALLRRVQREKGTERKTLAVTQTPAEQAHPQWLITRWKTNLGGGITRRIAEYDQAEPPEHTLFTDNEGLPPIDEGSRLIAELAAAAIPFPRRILDCCAAPGGKTAVLALRHPAAEIIAADISEKRLATMRNRLDRDPATAHIQTILADMTNPLATPSEVQPTAKTNPGIVVINPARAVILSTAKEPSNPPERPRVAQSPATEAAPTSVPPIQGLFDLILCDAPCSGTGTLARNPEIRHRLRESDLKRQADRQSAILMGAISLLAPGGRIVYSTCSMEQEENEAVIQKALAADPTLKAIPIEPLLQDTTLLSETGRTRLLQTAIHQGALRTLPGTNPCDGFYAAILERV